MSIGYFGCQCFFCCFWTFSCFCCFRCIYQDSLGRQESFTVPGFYKVLHLLKATPILNTNVCIIEQFARFMCFIEHRAKIMCFIEHRPKTEILGENASSAILRLDDRSDGPWPLDWTKAFFDRRR